MVSAGQTGHISIWSMLCASASEKGGGVWAAAGRGTKASTSKASSNSESGNNKTGNRQAIGNGRPANPPPAANALRRR